MQLTVQGPADAAAEQRDEENGSCDEYVWGAHTFTEPKELEHDDVALSTFLVSSAGTSKGFHKAVKSLKLKVCY